MTNKERLHKFLDLEGLIIQPINSTLEQVSKRTSKKRRGYLKCVTDVHIADGLIEAVASNDKGLVGFMIFVPQNEFRRMYEVENERD